MSEIDNMARELLADEYERDGRLGMASLIREPHGLVDDDDRSFRAIRTALLTAPPGWKLVPEKITESMRNAWDSAPDNEDDDISFWGAYSAMIAAAPEPK